MGCCLCCFRKTAEIDPKAPRSCTDIIALIFFALFLIGMFVITVIAAQTSDIWRIFYGTDSFGNLCGRPNPSTLRTNFSGMDMTEKTFVFSMDILRPKRSMWICVEKCPDPSNDEFGIIITKEQLKKHAREVQSHLCRYDIKFDDYNNVTYSSWGPCPKLPVFKSKPIFRRCIPTIARDILAQNAKDIKTYLNEFDKVLKVFADIYACWKKILLLCIVSLGIAFIGVFVLRWVAVVFIYAVFAFVAILLCVAAVLLWYYYSGTMEDELKGLFNQSNEFLDVEVENQTVGLVCSVAVTCFIGIVLITICCCVYRRLSLVLELFKQADKCLKSMPILLLQPLWTFLALASFVVYWFVVALMLATTTQANLSKLLDEEAPNVTLIVADFSIKHLLQYFWWYHFVALIWITEFILACQQMVIAGSITVWYFAKEKNNVNCAVCRSTGQLIRYHLGSVALGSFIITLVKVPRFVLMYLQKKYEATGSLLLKYTLWAFICLFWCVEKCLKFINQNAYIVIAIEGSSFCPAGFKACTILFTNALQLTTVNLLGDFILLVGKCAVTAIVGVICLILFNEESDIEYWYVPTIIVCVFAFFVAHCFFSVYEMVIDTLFICHCEYKRVREEKKELVIHGQVAEEDAVDPNITVGVILRCATNSNTLLESKLTDHISSKLFKLVVSDLILILIGYTGHFSHNRKTHLQQFMDKLGAENKQEAAGKETAGEERIYLKGEENGA